jgi:hypothetical protein
MYSTPLSGIASSSSDFLLVPFHFHILPTLDYTAPPFSRLLLALLNIVLRTMEQ